MKSPRRALAGALAALAVLGGGTAVASAAARPSMTATGPCGQSDQPPPTFGHVVVIVMENRAYDQIVGNPAAPRINSLAGSCGVATNYQHVGTGDGDKILMTSGSTWGLRTGGLKNATLHVLNIFSEAGDWAVFAEGMPRPCFRGNSSGYVYRHNPALAYADIAAQCPSRDRPLQALNLSARYTMILPSLGHSMHQSGTVAIRRGDAWLGSMVDRMVATDAYRSGNTAIFVVWDEGGSRLPLLVISPYTTPGTRSSRTASHVALLRTTQDLLSLPPFATTVEANSFAADFGLTPQETPSPTPTPSSTPLPTNSPTEPPGTGEASSR
jgi:hypothetical protein